MFTFSLASKLKSLLCASQLIRIFMCQEWTHNVLFNGYH